MCSNRNPKTGLTGRRMGLIVLTLWAVAGMSCRTRADQVLETVWRTNVGSYVIVNQFTQDSKKLLVTVDTSHTPNISKVMLVDVTDPDSPRTTFVPGGWCGGAAISSDMKKVIAANGRGVARWQWDGSVWTRLGDLAGWDFSYGMGFTPDSSTLVFLAGDVFGLPFAASAPAWRHSDWSRGGVSFSPDGAYFVHGRWYSGACVRRTSDGVQVMTLAGHNTDCSWSPANNRVAVQSDDPLVVRVYDSETWELKWEASGGEISPGRFTADGSMYAVVHQDRLEVFDSVNGNHVGTWWHEGFGNGRGLAFSPDGQYVAYGAANGDVVLARWTGSTPVGLLTADPTTVPADNATTSTLTLTYKNADGTPIVGHSIRFFTDRMSADTLSPESAVTDAEGKASITVKSSTPGVSTYTCHDASDGERKLACSAQVTYRSPNDSAQRPTIGKITTSQMRGNGFPRHGPFFTGLLGLRTENTVTVWIDSWGGPPGQVRFVLNADEVGARTIAPAPGVNFAMTTYDMSRDLESSPLGKWNTLEITVTNADGSTAKDQLHWFAISFPPCITDYQWAFQHMVARTDRIEVRLAGTVNWLNVDAQRSVASPIPFMPGRWGMKQDQGFPVELTVLVDDVIYPEALPQGTVKVAIGIEDRKRYQLEPWPGYDYLDYVSLAGLFETKARVSGLIFEFDLSPFHLKSLQWSAGVGAVAESPDVLTWGLPNTAPLIPFLEVFGRGRFNVDGAVRFEEDPFSPGRSWTGGLSALLQVAASVVVSTRRELRATFGAEMEMGLALAAKLEFPGDSENIMQVIHQAGARAFIAGRLWVKTLFGQYDLATNVNLGEFMLRPDQPYPQSRRPRQAGDGRIWGTFRNPDRRYGHGCEPYHIVSERPTPRYPFKPGPRRSEDGSHSLAMVGPAQRFLDQGNSDVTELELIRNVVPVASPALVVSDGRRIIAHVYDNPALPPHQCSEVRVLAEQSDGTYREFAVTDDVALDSQPGVQVTSDNRIVVVWTRIPVAVDGESVVERASKCEIAWSILDTTSWTWSPACLLTENQSMDVQPTLVRGAGGSLYVVWLNSPDNVFPLDPSQPVIAHTDIWMARWTGDGFGDPTRIVVGANCAETPSASGLDTPDALVVWGRDADGDPETPGYQLEYSRMTGESWTAPSPVPCGSTSSQSATVLGRLADGRHELFCVADVPVQDHPHQVRQSLLRVVFDPQVGWSEPAMLGEPGGFSSLTGTVQSNGDADLVWVSPAKETADLRWTHYHSDYGTLSYAQLTDDDPEECDLTVAASGDGNVYAAYLKRRLEQQPRLIKDSQGNDVEVLVNAIVASDLFTLTCVQTPDLALSPANLQVTPGNAGPGSLATVFVSVTNTRTGTARGVHVRLVDCTPDGDNEIATVVTDPAVIVGGGSAMASTTWTVPSDGKAHTIVAIVDPDGEVTETDESNNTASYALLPPDLAAGAPFVKEYLPDGSLKLELPIRNVSSVSMGTAVEWKLWLGEAGTGTLLRLGETQAPAPGETIGLEVIWSPGGSTPSNQTLTLVVDPDAKLDDYDPSNNTASGDIALRPDLILNPYDGTFTWNADGSGTAEVTLQNNGWCAAQDIVVAVLSGPPDSPETVTLGSATVQSLDRYSHTRVGIAVPSRADLCEIYVVANPEGTIEEVQGDNNMVILTAPEREATNLWTIDRVGTITELAILRQYDLKRVSDNALLEGKAISFKIDGTEVGTAVTNAGGDSTFNWLITDGPATRTITVEFAGDAAHRGCSADATMTCETHATKMSGVNREGQITAYRVLKAWLYRLDNKPVVGKTVSFQLDGTLLGTDVTRATGLAQIGYTIADGAGAGVRTILAEWAGDGGYLPSSCTNTLTVQKATPYIWVMPRSVPQGGVARMYAYFRRLADYQKQEGKTVSFKVDGTWVADVATGTGADAGIARYLYTTVEPVGTHTMRCEFAGDAWLEAGYGEANLTIY